jgi:hypothetical protein
MSFKDWLKGGLSADDQAYVSEAKEAFEMAKQRMQQEYEKVVAIQQIKMMAEQHNATVNAAGIQQQLYQYGLQNHVVGCGGSSGGSTAVGAYTATTASPYLTGPVTLPKIYAQGAQPVGIGSPVLIAFTDCDGVTFRLRVNENFAPILDNISTSHIGNLKNHAAYTPVMVSGEFSEEEMSLAESIIDDLSRKKEIHA